MFVLPELPYPYDALAPVISAETMHAHHDKHHRAYVEKTNELAASARLTGRPLEEVLREALKSGDKPLFNNAAQAWNHAFFWRCMRPAGGGGPEGDLIRAIDEAFDGLEELRDAFVEEGAEHFASGWVWIVTGAQGLQVISTHDGANTLTGDGLFPLLVCDLWEHAYYLDYKNDRKAYLERWFDNLANWEFAAAQFAASDGLGESFRYPAPTAERAEDDGRSETQRPSL